MDCEKIVKAYLKLRDARTTLRKQFEAEDGKLEAHQDLLEKEMLRFLDSTGGKSFATTLGTFYKSVDVKPMASDWSTIYRWATENDGFEILQKRLTKTFITKYMESHDGHPPPGVSVSREYVVNVRSK